MGTDHWWHRPHHHSSEISNGLFIMSKLSTDQKAEMYKSEEALNNRYRMHFSSVFDQELNFQFTGHRWCEVIWMQCILITPTLVFNRLKWPYFSIIFHNWISRSNILSFSLIFVIFSNIGCSEIFDHVNEVSVAGKVWFLIANRFDYSCSGFLNLLTLSVGYSFQ